MSNSFIEQLFGCFDVDEYYKGVTGNQEDDWGEDIGNECDDEFVMEPKSKAKTLAELFEGYDTSKSYPFEIVDKDGVVVHELE